MKNGLHCHFNFKKINLNYFNYKLYRKLNQFNPSKLPSISHGEGRLRGFREYGKNPRLQAFCR